MIIFTINKINLILIKIIKEIIINKIINIIFINLTIRINIFKIVIDKIIKEYDMIIDIKIL